MLRRLTPLTLVLLLIALWLLSLAIWSLSLGIATTKGVIFAGYALILGYFALRTAPRPRVQFVMLGSILVALIGGEIATRLINDPPEDPDFRQGSPYIMFAGQPNGTIEADDIELNELGYRDMPTLPKTEGEYRIIMLGGSTVFQGSPRQYSLAGAIETNLQGQGYAQVKVYNWGVYSVVSGQELAALLYRAVDYEPDMVLVYDGSNDLTEPYFFDPRPNYPFDYMATEGGQRLLEGHWGLYDLYAVLLRPTSLGYTLFQFEIEEQLTQRSQLVEEVNSGSEEWQGQLATHYAANLGKMCKLAQAFDFQLVTVLQPMIFFKDQWVGQEPQWIGSEDYQAHTRHTYELTRSALEHLSEDYANEPCLFRDGSYFLQFETQELFVDPVHLNHEGNLIMGGRLAQLLTPLLD